MNAAIRSQIIIAQKTLDQEPVLANSQAAPGPAKAVVTDQGDVLMAVSKYGKGTVFAVVDPWVYNEYVDRRNRLPADYDGFAAAIDLAGWAVRQVPPTRH